MSFNTFLTSIYRRLKHWLTNIVIALTSPIKLHPRNAEG